MLYDFEHQVLIGTILGGSSLVKPPKGRNFYLSMRSNNDKWLRYKMEEMPKFFNKPKVHLYGSTYRCNSRCCETLTDIKDILYDGNKRRVSMNVLNSLRDIALAVWYLDSGSKTGRGRKNAYINTTKFGESGSEIIKSYFNEVDMLCNINRDGSRLKVLFTVQGTISLFKTIAYRFPSFMHNCL